MFFSSLFPVFFLSIKKNTRNSAGEETRGAAAEVQRIYPQLQGEDVAAGFREAGALSQVAGQGRFSVVFSIQHQGFKILAVVLHFQHVKFDCSTANGKFGTGF